MLKLVLQTQEGQQIEVTVGPDDTFADLQRHYESPDNPGLSDLLKHLITNGTEVDENTKVFDYVTNSSSTEWLVEESLENIGALDSIIDIKTPQKECCVEGCSNTELTAPEKIYFPLPNDQDRLSSWLIGIGRPELFDIIQQSDTDLDEKYFVCGDHFAPHHFLKGTNQVLKRRAYPSLPPASTVQKTLSTSILKSRTALVKAEIPDETVELEIKKEDSTDEPNTMDSGTKELLKGINEMEHPGVLCRLCGEHTVNPIYLYSDSDGTTEYSLADKINLCLPITVDAKDPLPKQLCKECHERLNTSHKLAMTCLRTEDKLKAMLLKKKFHVVDKTDKQCPLCVHGDMKMVTKSGIYRKDKLENNPQSLKNSSARTRIAMPSKNSNVKTPVDRATHSGLDDAVPKSTPLEILADDDVSLPPVTEDEFSCSICSKKTPDIEYLLHHAEEHPNFPCTICKDVQFGNVNDQKLHFLRYHGYDQGYCDLCCHELTDDMQNAIDHIKIRKPEFSDTQCIRCGEQFPDECRKGSRSNSNLKIDRFECDQCGKKFRRKANLNQHMKIHEKNDPITCKCSFCDKEFSRKGSLHKHISKVHWDVEFSVYPKCYKCKNCDEAFTTSANVEAHITEKHFSQLMTTDMTFISDQFTGEQLSLNKVYICEYCERCYTVPSSLNEHRQSEHSTNLDYRCNVCEGTFVSYKLMANHKALHAKTNQLEDSGIKLLYLCKYCNKVFLHYTTLRMHKNHHHESPTPYLCRLCNTSFASYKEVLIHRRTTHPYQSVLHERPNNLYQCQYCEKRFTHELVLIKHIRMHTGERPYKCKECGKGFSQTSGLYTHLKVHSDLRPYECPLCNRTFKIKGDRDNHARKHSGHRPYKCEFCDKAFMTQHVYSQHRKIHTDERPYKCDICELAFRRSHVLTVHMRRHTGEKPHTCDLCPKTYRQRGDLLKHMKMQHGIGSSGCNNKKVSDSGTLKTKSRKRLSATVTASDTLSV